MGTTQGISLHSYLHLKLEKKKPCFSYYFLYFSFNKIREQEGRTDSAPRWGDWVGGKGDGGPNNVHM
jgi:hypothetical protein